TTGALLARIATMTLDAIYTTERDAVAERVVRDVQQTLDAYGTGIRMVAVSLLSVHAPEEVHAAFRDVASAQEDKILIVDRATTFAREAVNLAEGDAAAMIETARAFKDQKILEAEGDALAFTLPEKEYRRAPDLTRFRLPVEAPEDVLRASKKTLVIHSLVTWRIADPERFLATTGGRVTAEQRLSDVVLTKIGSVVGSHPSAALVAVEGHASQFEQIMGRIVSEARQRAIADYGIDLVDIQLRQLGLPEQNRANVFARMQAERGKIAMTYRSEGEREFKKVVAEAEREKTRILAEAYREAERTKGAGD